MRILLIAGHGAGDPGAIGNGYEEADVVRDIVARVKPLLSRYAEVDVFDTSKKMSNYLYKGNKFDFTTYQYVFEFHLNAFKKDEVGDGKNNGTELIVHTSEGTVGVESKILDNMAELGFTNRGVKRKNDLIVANVCKGQQNVSYALMEVCFIDDIDDMTLYNMKKQEIINAIVSGMVEGFVLKPIGTDLTNLNDIVAFLSDNEVLTDRELWKGKAKADKDVYWLMYKMAKVLRR